jgi:hypothetical protein
LPQKYYSRTSTKKLRPRRDETVDHHALDVAAVACLAHVLVLVGEEVRMVTASRRRDVSATLARPSAAAFMVFG